jgi:thioesterase domain-containing protein
MVVHPHGVDTTIVPATIEEMARDRLPYILSALRPGPVLVGGYCNGGLLALETARLLDAAGHTVLGVVMLDATNDNARFQRVAAAVNRYARWRGLPALQTRDLLLRWFDRQTTLEQLLGLDGVPGRFSSVRQRLAFVATVLKRKLLRLPSAEGTARRRTTTGVSRHDVLFDAYALATTAYVAQPFAGRVALIVSDDLPFETTVEQWAPVTRDVTTYRVSGDHRDAVTGQLESVAETVARIVAEYSARI